MAESLRAVTEPTAKPAPGGVAFPRVRLTSASLSVLLSLPALALFLGHVMAQAPLFIDDSYIFYRYAENWADGRGPVFNPGEHVEGFSSVLWTAVLSLGAAFSVRPEDLAPVLGIVLGVVSLLLLSRLTRALLPEWPLLWAIVPLAAALSSGFVAFTTSGMDTLLFIAAVLAATTAAVDSVQSGRTALLSVALIALVFARAEGALYALAILGMLWVVLRQQQAAYGPAALLQTSLLTAAAILLLVAGRFVYYRDFLPATVVAKGYAGHAFVTTIESGFRRWGELRFALGRGIVYQREVLALLMLPLALLALRSRRPHQRTVLAWIVATPIVVNVAITAWSSGDWMPLHRLNLAILPLLLLLIACEFEHVVRHSADLEPSVTSGLSTRLPALLLVATVLAAGAFFVERPVIRPAIVNIARHDEQPGFNLFARQAGIALKGVQPAPTLLSDVIGEVSYYAGPSVYVWDIYGLTDEHNSKSGARWTPSVGRSDDAYINSRPFDVLVTNDPSTLLRLFEYWQAAPGQDLSDRYAVLPRPEWLSASFFVVVRNDHPAAAVLEALCLCEPGPLTEEFIRDQRPPWKTRRFGEPPQ